MITLLSIKLSCLIIFLLPLNFACDTDNDNLENEKVMLKYNVTNVPGHYIVHFNGRYLEDERVKYVNAALLQANTWFKSQILKCEHDSSICTNSRNLGKKDEHAALCSTTWWHHHGCHVVPRDADNPMAGLPSDFDLLSCDIRDDENAEVLAGLFGQLSQHPMIKSVTHEKSVTRSLLKVPDQEEGEGRF